jgi:hypothetical protein
VSIRQILQSPETITHLSNKPKDLAGGESVVRVITGFCKLS